jgi:putative transcriptional regulator
MRSFSLPVAAVALFTASFVLQAGDPLAAGKVLVATEKLGDPAFAESVILIISRDADGGTLGLMINRRTQVPLSRLFDKNKHVGADPVYIGGPVDLTLVQALLRAPDHPERSTHLVDDVYSTADKRTIEDALRAQLGPSRFRLYLGYAGWAPQQLESEIRLGAWSVIDGSARIVFDPHPDSLWDRLDARRHMQIARFVVAPALERAWR